MAQEGYKAGLALSLEQVFLGHACTESKPGAKTIPPPMTLILNGSTMLRRASRISLERVLGGF